MAGGRTTRWRGFVFIYGGGGRGTISSARAISLTSWPPAQLSTPPLYRWLHGGYAHAVPAAAHALHALRFGGLLLARVEQWTESIGDAAGPSSRARRSSH